MLLPIPYADMRSPFMHVTRAPIIIIVYQLLHTAVMAPHRHF